MASGDVVFFEQFYVDVQEGLHDLETDVIKLGFITSATTPTAATADPRWGAGGTTNMSTNEVTAGGNYTSGGPTCANNAVTLVSGAGRFHHDDVSILQNASNPTNARWGIYYNHTDAGKRAIGYVDFGSDRNLADGDFDWAPNASGVSSMAAA